MTTEVISPVAPARIAALGAIAILGIAVAIISIGAAVSYFGIVAIGPRVRWSEPSNGGQLIPQQFEFVNAMAFLFWNLTTACLALIVARLAWRIRRGVEFVPAVSRAAWALAIVLALGTWLAQIAERISSQAVASYPDNGGVAVDVFGFTIDWGIGPETFLPNGGFLGLALVLGVLAYIIGAGERLQRETEGLV